MKTAVITGASSGLGREFVRQFYSVFPEIERVWLIARRTDRLQELAEQLKEKGISTLTLPLDLCDTMSFTAYQEHLVEEQPEIALLVNNAGCGYLGNIGEIDTVSQTRMIDLNLRALTCHHQFVGALYGSREPDLERQLHRLLLPYPPDDGVFRHESLCFRLHHRRGGGTEGKRHHRYRRLPPAPWPQSFWQWVMWWIPGAELLPCPTAVGVVGGALRAAKRGLTSTPPDCSISSTVCWQNSPRPN